MASDLEFVEYIGDQLGDTARITFKKMFGEYALYYQGKVVALVCDNQLYVKPTPGGQALLGQVTTAPPYPGAKPHLLIQEQLDDRDTLAALIRITAQELPEPAKKKAKAAPRSGKRI